MTMRELKWVILDTWDWIISPEGLFYILTVSFFLTYLTWYNRIQRRNKAREEKIKAERINAEKLAQQAIKDAIVQKVNKATQILADDLKPRNS